jgi:antitoxin component HigA of HigAB toxin-antitoxin module
LYKFGQRQIMCSQSVLSSALQSPDLDQLPAVRSRINAATWVENGLVVDFPGDSEIMRIAFTDSNPKTAAAIVNAVTNAYLHETDDIEVRKHQARLTILKSTLDDSEVGIGSKLDEAKRMLDGLSPNDKNAPPPKKRTAWKHFVTRRSEHQRKLFERMRSNLALVEMGLARDASSVELQNFHLARMIDGYAEISPEQSDLQSKIDRMRRLVEHNESVAPNSPALKKQRNDLKLAEQEMAEVKELAELLEPHGRAPLEVEILRAEMKQIEKLSVDLEREIESLRVELRVEPRVKPLLTADIPQKRNTDGRLGRASVAALLAFLLSMLAFTLWDRCTRRQVEMLVPASSSV